MAFREDSENRSLISKGDTRRCPTKCPDTFHIDVWLLKYKAFFILLYGAVHSIFPYLALHYRQLGMNATQIGIAQGMLPFICFVSAPAFGYIGDKFRIHKLILICSIVIWIGVFLGIALLPPPAESELCPGDLNLTNTNMTQEQISGLVTGYNTDVSWIYETNSVDTTFAIICVCMFVGGMLWAPVGTLSDVALLYDLQEQDQMDKFGAQRAFGSVGRTVFHFITGVIIESTVTVTVVCGVTIHFGDYRWAYFVFIICMSGALLISFTFKFNRETNDKTTNSIQCRKKSEDDDLPMTVESPDTKDMSDDNKQSDLRMFCKLLSDVEYTSWLITSFFLGYYNGTTTGFLYWYLGSLGGTGLLMGLTGAISSITQMIFFYITSYFVKKFGRQASHYFVMMCLVARYANYAFMYNPWLILVSQVLEGAIEPIAWVAIVDLSESKLEETAKGLSIGVLHGVFKGLGPGLGIILGGVSFTLIGARTTFMVLTVCSSAWCVVLVIIQLVANHGDVVVFSRYQKHQKTLSNSS